MSRYIEPLKESPDESLKLLELRISGRKMGAEVAKHLIGEHLTSLPYMESLIDELTKLAGISEPDAEPEAEKHEPIARLGRMQMVFGVHKGKPFDDIPLDYLDWLCRTQEEFYKTLRAYLRHPELESRRAGEIGEPDGD